MTDEESFPIRYIGLAAEARQYAWFGTQAQNHQATAETQRDLAQADADHHLRNARHLGSLLESIARTMGANPLDFNELPALVDGCRTTSDQASIRASDLAHALDKAHAGATFWKTHLVRESTQLRDLLAKTRLTTARAEARAGAYCLAYDHLDAVTRKLLDLVHAHLHGDDIATADPLGAAADAVRDVLSRDLESYLAEPYDDITPDTRVDLTPAGRYYVSPQVDTPKPPCQPSCGIGYHLQGCPHIGTQLGIAPDGTELATPTRSGSLCSCTWLGIGTPEHPPTSLCLTPEQDQANNQRHHDLTTTVSYAADYRPAATFQEQRKAYEQQQATGASVPRVAREEVLQEEVVQQDVLQLDLALDSAHEELAQYRREIDHIRRRFLIGRAVEETFTVGELLAVFRDGPSVASPTRLSERREGEVIHPTDDVLCDVADEREAQDERLGEQNHRDGTSRLLAGMADDARRDAQHTASQNRLTWLDILAEQFWAAMAEEDPEVLRGRLVQVAAWAVAWAEHLDRRTAAAANPVEPQVYPIESTVHAELDEDQDAAYDDEPTLTRPGYEGVTA